MPISIGAIALKRTRSRPGGHQDAFERGHRAIRAGRYADAARYFSDVPKRHPQFAEAKFHRGLALFLEGSDSSLAQAVRLMEAALKLAPLEAGWWSNLGLALERMAESRKAEAAFRRSLALRPDHVETLANLSVTRRNLGDMEGAEASLQEAANKRPDDPKLLTSLGNIQSLAGRPADAIASLQKAANLAPERASTRYALGLAALREGDFGLGWANYRFRFGASDAGLQPETGLIDRSLDQPAWDGRPIRGLVRVWIEQGIGDQILYSSILPDVIEAGHDILLECDPRMVAIYRRSFPGLSAVLPVGSAASEPASAASAQIAIGDLGGLFRRSLEEFPKQERYLVADPERTARQREKYARLAQGRPIVGLAWRSANRSLGRFKSTRLSDWAGALRASDAFFVNLQYGDCEAEIADLARTAGIQIYSDPEVDQLASLEDLFCQVAALDLLLSTSNSAVHVAGALGVPSRVLLPCGRGSLWYWFQTREDCLWYRSVQIVRQQQGEPWSAATARLVKTS